jgi:hypothetical protein
MRYSDIADYPRRWDRDRYPSVAHVYIATGQFGDFERLIEDQTQTTMLGHHIADDGKVLVYVACSSDDVKDSIESHWG